MKTLYRVVLCLALILSAKAQSVLPFTEPLQNDGSTGTTINKLVSKSAAGLAIVTPAASTTGIFGVVISNAGTSGSAIVQKMGPLPIGLASDGSVTAGHLIGVSASVAGDGTDVSSCPGSGAIGWWTQTGSGAGTYSAFIDFTICPPVSGTGTVNSGTGGHLTYYATSTNAVSDLGADFTFATHTLAGGSSSILDLSAAPVTTGLKLPSAASAAPTADGQIAENTTTHHPVAGVNGATFDLLPMTAAGDLVYGGANGAPTKLVKGTDKQILISGTTPAYIDFPDPKIIPAANCVNSVAGAGWSAASTFTPNCRAGSNNLGGVLDGTPSTGATAYFDYELPGDWHTSVNPYISIYYGSGSNTSGTVIWTVSTACTKQDGSITDDPAWIAESAMGTQTMANANRMWAQNAQLAGAMTNCVAGSTLLVKLALSGTASSAVRVSKAVITIPRLLTVQAN